ncbi:hypothetical protein DEJ47_12900 [Streptomyces venezuelae]|uniref:Uncharacterized protein n=2 Tax=Streptomyces venezuelae TaxID=54571 RepID=A0A5P2BAA3_STRVZ|nr:hypothetical protein DEJ47_12900 [Streptomyces venezuelae]
MRALGVFWGERMEPNPITGTFMLEPTAPPETVQFFRAMEELLPIYGGSIPESAALLDQVLRQDVIGVLDPGGQKGKALPVAEFAATAGVGPDELRVHAHHLHASGALAVTRKGLLQTIAGARMPAAHG